ncbi:hypothetical protein [Streptomyces nanshensis]|uniref:HhH-GPD domain-containing protein n=1 Tax=Streptomyces nanshensis TaxID=518642 RepID=A0A1E7KZL6_9ACTN|nr:hypothetical protein [Streptomyces nanshensis]OEV09321.1 hypothetical protein AN218_23095 [Streptomyces nanshensis]
MTTAIRTGPKPNQEQDVSLRQLDHADTLELPVTGDGPFNFLHTAWKPSHYVTGLEAHTASRSWRTFRVDDLVTGVRMHAENRLVIAEVYTDGDYKPEHRDHLARRLTASYGLDEDLSQFIELATDVPTMRGPLESLSGMRQSCPEDHFEIAVVALLLQHVTVARTTQMTRNLLTHYGQLVRFDGITLRAWFTPAEIAHVSAEIFKEQDRLGYRAKTLPRFAAFFRDYPAEELTAAHDLEQTFQQIKGVGPYTAAIMASHASRDTASFGLDVWNRKILARRLLSADDAAPEAVNHRLNELFPGHAGTAGLYLVEYEYLNAPVAPLLTPGGDVDAWNEALAGVVAEPCNPR